MSDLHSHVGIPKCLQLEFSNKEQIQVYDFARNKTYSCNCDRAGTENHYYDEETEKILSEKVESSLGVLIKELRACFNNVEFTNCLQRNTDVLEAFFKFQLQRSKKMLEGVNKKSISTKIFGDLSHSEMIKILDKSDANILNMLEGSLFALRIVCDDDLFLITNSLGFYCVLDNKKLKYFIIPLSNKDAICIQSGFDKENPYSHYTLDERHCDYLNKSCYEFEKALGNGYIYAKEKFELEKFLKKQKIEIISNLK